MATALSPQGLTFTVNSQPVEPIIPFECHRDFRNVVAAVIPPFLAGLCSRIHAAIFSFCAVVMPPMSILGRSLLYVHSHVGMVSGNSTRFHLGIRTYRPECFFRIADRYLSSSLVRTPEWIPTFFCETEGLKYINSSEPL